VQPSQQKQPDRRHQLRKDQQCSAGLPPHQATVQGFERVTTKKPGPLAFVAPYALDLQDSEPRQS
jgi:hypothetical protein